MGKIGVWSFITRHWPFTLTLAFLVIAIVTSCSRPEEIFDARAKDYSRNFSPAFGAPVVETGRVSDCPSLPPSGKDASPAFKCAIAKASRLGGGIVLIPSGTHLIGSTLQIPEGVTLQGMGLSSVLKQPHSLLGPVVRLAATATLRDLQLIQEQPKPEEGKAWQPYSDYDYQIKIEGDKVTVQDVKLLNPYLGILVSPEHPEGAVGQIFIRNIRAQPLKEGLRIDHALDVVHVNTLHFWPFWSADPAVLDWTTRNGRAIITLRADNPMFSDLFFFAYHAGIEFSSSSCKVSCGITSKPKINQMDCDACEYGILVSAPHTKGILVNQFSAQGIMGEFGGRHVGVGVFVNAPDVSMLLNHLDLTGLSGNAIRVRGRDVLVQLSNSIVRQWDLSRKKFPAFELVGGPQENPGTIVDIQQCRVGDGGGAPVFNQGINFRP